ncbi:hypothetical protein [Cohnella phaseoli]|uniref:SMC-like protein with flexible hinge domain n=1 Tax=Cohnella phaseoli TaxID=456490 RepID=A0A3D9JR76_9BACL|nr:hypothetical protein [Cohnella phaseoli]RED75946.1 SMC-like protein with flexible hinge domain [Cohnella phaseoli]
MNQPVSKEEMNSQIIQLQRKLEAIISRKNTLLELCESYDRVSKGARDVLLAGRRRLLDGVCGIVADYIDFPEKYLIAMISILGDVSDYVLIENFESAANAIAYLKKRQSGSVAFLSLDRVVGKTIDDTVLQKALRTKGYLGKAIELVTVDEAYLPVFTHLLGDVLIVEDLKAANEVSNKTKQRCKVVTLEGDVIGIDGVLRGGAFVKPMTHLLYNKSLIRNLDQEIKEVETQLHRLRDSSKEGIID